MGARFRSVREVLAGEADERSLAENAATSRLLIIAAIVVSNVVGAIVVTVLLTSVLPIPPEARRGDFAGIAGVGATAAALYVVVALVVGYVVGLRRGNPVSELYRSGRTPTEEDRSAVLRLPLDLFVVQATLWGVAALVFGGAALGTSTRYAGEVALTTVLGGIPTACLAYLLTQRLLRGGVAVVLADAPPRREEVPGVGARAMVAWALGTVPVGGIAAVAIFAPYTHASLIAVVRAVAVLAGISVAVGVLAVAVFARGVAEPLQRMRDAFGRVESGDFDVAVPVFDATEVGHAAAGFNRMAAGLRERERLRDLFGRQVGGDVARQALEQGVRLGGEERDVAALFVDVLSSTSFAAERTPTEVVDALNAFFAAVVGAVSDRGGLVNKFMGDAALCIFGAPLTDDDPAGSALAAARDIARRLRDVELAAGIGVAYGTAVAGNVGTAERYEYTVIGDPVNEAARLTDLAKERPGRVLASQQVLDAAGADEAARWRRLDEEVTLRGRSRSTRLAVPSDGDEDDRSGREP